MCWAYDDPSLTLENLLQHWEEAWQRHDLDLKRYFAGRSNFFAFNISVPSEQADICRFLRRRGYRIRGKVLPHADARSAQAATDSRLATALHHRYLGPPAFGI